MGLIWAVIRRNRAGGAVATSYFEEVKKSYTVQNIILQPIARENDTQTGSDLLGITSRLDRIFLNTITGSNIVDWEGQHLYDFNVQALKIFPFAETAQADNVPIGTSFNLPLSPFPYDFDRNYGAAPNRLTQMQIDWAADVASSNGDAGQYSVVAVGNPDISSPIGMLANSRDAFTAAAVGEQRDTNIIGKRLTGIFNFGTTSFADIAAAGAFDVTTFRDHSITESDDVKLGPVQEFSLFANQNDEIGAVIDEGSLFWDLGFKVSGDPIGFNIAGGDWAYRSTRGVTDAGITYPIRLI